MHTLNRSMDKMTELFLVCVCLQQNGFSFVRLISIFTECNLNDLTNNKPFETQLNIIILTHTMQR